MRPRDTVEMQGFELVAILVATSDLQNFFLGPLRAPKEPSGMENWPRYPWETPSPSARQIVCMFAKDSGQKCLRGPYICSDSGRRIWPCKNAGNLACGHRRGTLGRPSDELEAENSFSKKPLNLTTTFWIFSALIGVVTRHRKYATNRVGEPLRSTLCFSDFWQKRAQVLLCTFRRGHGTP